MHSDRTRDSIKILYKQNLTWWHLCAIVDKIYNIMQSSTSKKNTRSQQNPSFCRWCKDVFDCITFKGVCVTLFTLCLYERTVDLDDVECCYGASSLRMLERKTAVMSWVQTSEGTEVNAHYCYIMLTTCNNTHQDTIQILSGSHVQLMLKGEFALKVFI